MPQNQMILPAKSPNLPKLLPKKSFMTLVPDEVDIRPVHAVEVFS
jgi:hypothetical protein